MKNKCVLRFTFVKVLFIAGSLLSSHAIFAQRKAAPFPIERDEELEDSPEKRLEWERLRTMDPATKKVPEGIQKKELLYVRSMTSGLRRVNPLKNLGPLQRTSADSITEDFTNRGPYNIGGRSRALAIDILNEQHIIAGGVSGGVWSSENQGRTWTRRSSLILNPVITDVAQDTRTGHERTWYYSTGEWIGNSSRVIGNGVFKSTDNGVTWRQLEATNNNTPGYNYGDYFKYIQNIEIHPATGDIYIATWDGIVKSTDGGNTFARVLRGNIIDHTEVEVLSLDVHITIDGVIYASIPDDGIYRSTTGDSESWTKISPTTFPSRFNRGVIGSAPSNSKVVYFLLSGTPEPEEHNLWKYTYSSGNGSGTGGTWVNRTSGIPTKGSGGPDRFDSQHGYDLLVKVHPSDENIVFIGGTNLFRATDGFASTTNTTKLGGYDIVNHHPDQHALVFFNSNSYKALSGCDGGIFLTTDILDSRVEWTSLNNGYLTTQSYAVSIGPNNTIMSGFQDQSTWFTNLNDAQAAWTEIGGGDGCGNAFSKDGVFAYWSAQGNALARSQFTQVNDILDFIYLTPEGSCPNRSCNFVTTFAMDPNNDDILYLTGNKTVWRNNRASSASDDIGWTEISNTQTEYQLTAIGVSTHPAHVVYIASIAGEIFRIDNAHVGNPTGVKVSTDKGLPALSWPSCLTVDPRDANRVFVVFSNYSTKSIFLTTDGGNTWNDVSGNLEQNPDGTGNGPSVRWLSIVGPNAETYLVGTSTGMYSTNTINGSQTTWTQVAESTIGNTIVEQIKSRDSDGLVVVASHGNGLFSGHYQVSPSIINVVKDPTEITVFSNAAPTVLQTSQLFTSTAATPSPITMSVVSNSDNSTVTTSVSDGTLTLSYAPNKTGDVTVVVKGVDANENFITTAVIVHVITVQKSQTITFNPIRGRTYKDPAIYLQATSSSGLPITYTSDNPAVATVTGNVVTIGDAGKAAITASQEGDTYYTAAATVAQSLNVAQLRQVITFPAIPPKPYGTADFLPGATTNSSSAITYTSDNTAVATIVDGKIHITGVGTSIITASAVSDANHRSSREVQQTLTVISISKGIQTISFPDIPAKPYGTADFLPGAATNSSSAITYTSDNTAVATIVDGKIHITGVGTSIITASAVADAFYEAAANVTKTLTVSKAAQTISLDVPALTVGGNPYTATPVGGASGNPVLLDTTTPAKVSVSGFTITPISAGQSQISATQSGNSNYLEASAGVDFCVNPKKPVVTQVAYNVLSSVEPTGNQWFLDNVQIAGATSQTLMITKSGSYTVTTTVEGCVSLPSDPLVYTADVSKPQDELSIYPNPISSELHVVLGGFDINSEVNISIHNLLGISLFNKIVVGSKIVTFSTSLFQNGAYIILATQGDKRNSKLFFKHD